MNNRSNLYHIAPKTVNDPIVLEKSFPEFFHSILRHNSTKQRMSGNGLDRSHDALGEEMGISRRIESDEFARGIQIGQRP